MKNEGVTVENLRAIELDLATSVWPDMTEHGWQLTSGPAFPEVLAADILVIGSPIWLREVLSLAPLPRSRAGALNADVPSPTSGKAIIAVASTQPIGPSIAAREVIGAKGE
jgi:hypothetical protein